MHCFTQVSAHVKESTTHEAIEQLDSAKPPSPGLWLRRMITISQQEQISWETFYRLVNCQASLGRITQHYIVSVNPPSGVSVVPVM
ncbi:MAG: hypothetical protein ACR2H4_00480 [Pyrinomonadaceae bacterium]